MKKLYFFIFITIFLFGSPNEPRSLTFKNVTKNSVTLHWIDNSDDESGFKIYRDGELIYITKPDETSYKDRFLYANRSYDYEVKATDFKILNRDQKRRADQIVSVFENNTTNIQYGYAQDINDGRGVTAGRVGFTTETGDLLELLKRYNNTRSGSKIGTYVYSLENNKTFNQKDFISSWKYEAENFRLFREIQDKLSEEFYYFPAMEKAYDLGLVMPVSLLVMYDTNIQHGMKSEVINGVYMTGLNEIIKDTPLNDSEEVWIDKFLGNRKHVLTHTKGWKSTDYRVTQLWHILYENPDLRAFTMYVDEWNNQEFNIH